MRIEISILRLAQVGLLAAALSACVPPGLHPPGSATSTSTSTASGSSTVTYTSTSTSTSTSTTSSSSSSTSTNTQTTAASCSFNGNTVASGKSVTAYQAASVPAGQSCVSQSRVCKNGVLSGSYSAVSCSVAAPSPLNGACGAANGVAISSAPPSNLCNAGSASAVSGTGPFNWSCNGSNGGSSASCSAPLQTAASGSSSCASDSSASVDGCNGAQASGSFQQPNYFSNYTGVNYGSNRPPWYVAGVDYPVGYSGTLKDPTAGGSLPSCASYSNNMVTVNAAVQPCNLSHLDFSLHGGICMTIEGGSSSSVVNITNSKFSSNMNVCPYFLIGSQTGAQALNIMYSEFDDNDAGFQSEVEWDGSGILTMEYNYYHEVSCRVVNSAALAGAGLHMRYNYLQDIGTAATGGCHGETVEWNTSNNISIHDESYNNYFASSASESDTAFLYIQSAIGNPQHGSMTTAIATNNVLITRPNQTQRNNISISGALWIDTTFGNSIGSLTVNSNYIDAAGSYFSILVNEGGSDPGSIGSSTCTGNKLMAQGTALTGSLGGGSSTVVCK